MWRTRVWLFYIVFVVVCSSTLAVLLPPRLASYADARDGNAGSSHVGEESEECRVCALHGAGAPQLFIKPKDDGLGGTTNSVIYGMALAASVGMRFGGMLRGSHTSHGVQLKAEDADGMLLRGAVANFFGVQDTNRIFPPEAPAMDATIGSVVDLGLLTAKVNVTIGFDHPPNVLFDAYPIEKAGPIGSFMSTAFVEALRQQVRPGIDARLATLGLTGPTSRVSQRAPLVVLHVRRGDVKTGQGRFTPTWWYLKVIRHIREALPSASFHVWSSTEGVHKASEFEPYRTRGGATVHLDGDPLDAWAHLASADVLVMAKSSFSTIPAYVNPSCVIFQDWRSSFKPLDEWMVGNDPLVSPADKLSPTFDEDLAKCISRVHL